MSCVLLSCCAPPLKHGNLCAFLPTPPSFRNCVLDSVNDEARVYMLTNTSGVCQQHSGWSGSYNLTASKDIEDAVDMALCVDADCQECVVPL